MPEFVVLFYGGGKSIIDVPDPTRELDIAISEQFPYESIDMVYRNATQKEATCPGTLLDHHDDWWNGFACKYCGTP